MGEGIQGPPNIYDAGLEFDYSVWPKGSQLDLVSVNWDNNYRDVVRFSSRTALNTYIDGLRPAGVRLDNVSYIKPGQAVRVPIAHNRAIRYNYLRVTNPLQPIEGGDTDRAYYYFINDVRYVAGNTTELVLQLDVFQTYVYDVTFGNCYVERGHIGIANEKAFDSYGRDYLTVPEGFDTGNEMQVIATKNKWILSVGVTTPPGESARYPGHDVLVISTVDLEADEGTVDNPKLNTAPGTLFQGTLQGAGAYIFTATQFINFLGAMKTKPWVTQGITSISVIPKFSRYYPDFVYSTSAGMGKLANTFFPKTFTHNLWSVWRNDQVFKDYIGERYSHLRKFWTYPYMAIELTTFTATPVLIKPESWNTGHARIFERASLMPPGQRLEFSPRYYNAIDNDDDKLPDLYQGYAELDEATWGYLEGVKGDDNGDYVDVVTQIANFPTMSLVNSGQLSYLASNVHGIAFQRQSAEWTQDRAIGMAAGQYDVATAGAQSALTQAKLGQVADYGQVANQNSLLQQQATVSAISGVLGGGAAGGTFGGARGAAGMGMAGGIEAIGNGVNVGAQVAANDQAAAIRNNTSRAQAEMQNTQAQLVADTNKDLANFAARGDYSNAIAGINARVQDAAMIQPTTSGQMGGEYMNLINGGWQVSLRWKMIDKAHIRIIGEYWLRYGYAIRAFIKMPENLMVMSKFTYWKTSETYISAGFISEGHKQVLRGMFEKGITVHSNPSYIGTIDLADNAPLEGISY